MTDTWWLILGVAVVLVVLIGGGMALLRSPKRPRTPQAPATPAPPVAAPEVETEATLPPTPVALEAEPVAPTLDTPEAPASRLVRLRQRLVGSQSALGRGLLALLSRDQLDEDTWESIEDTLLLADVGIGPATELVEALRTQLRVEGAGADPKAVLRQQLLNFIDPTMDRSLSTNVEEGPAVVLVVGVNGVGKTTSVGKIARMLVAEDRTVLLGAADTFRAAAAEQLATWGKRVGVEVVTGPEGSDPASVAFDSVKTGIEQGMDVVLVDTAGRLQNKAGLMDELGKVKRVIEKQRPVAEVLLVLDATTGQNGMSQARIFAEVVDVSGIVLTKLDGSAKGGIVLAVQRELGVPVKMVGLGEGPDDLAPFDPEVFVDALLQE